MNVQLVDLSKSLSEIPVPLFAPCGADGRSFVPTGYSVIGGCSGVV
jgi:hypothetical protein